MYLGPLLGQAYLELDRILLVGQLGFFLLELTADSIPAALIQRKNSVLKFA